MASFICDPSHIVVSTTGNWVRLNGTGTTWSGSPFSVTGGAGASITSQSVKSKTYAYIYVTAGSLAGALTISDGTNTAILTVDVSFTPLDLSGINLWLDASDATMITASSSASPPAIGTTTGTAVGTWFDKSGAGNHFSQASAPSAPIWNSSGGNIGSSAYVDMPYLGTNSTFLTERATNLYAITQASNTLLMLVYKYSTTEATYQTFFSNGNSGGMTELILRYPALGGLTRFGIGPSVTMSESAAHGWSYSYDWSNQKESIYLDTVASVATFVTERTAGETVTSYILGAQPAGTNGVNSQIYEVLLYNRTLAQAEISKIFAYWNTKYGSSLTSTLGSLTAPIIATQSVGSTRNRIAADNPKGGTFPYTFQWYRSTASGTKGSAVSGATSRVINDSGLSASTSYYYTLTTTDAASTSVDSAQLLVKTTALTLIHTFFLGDSITTNLQGTPGYKPPQAFVLCLESARNGIIAKQISLSAGGETVRMCSRVSGLNNNIVAKINCMIDAGYIPDYVCIMEGTNDVYYNSISTAGYTEANFVLDIADVCSAIHDAFPSAIMVLNDIMYTTGRPDATIQAYNADWVSQVNANPSFMIFGSQSDYSYFKANPSELLDGLHPGGTGVIHLARLWANALYPQLSTPFPNTGAAFTHGLGGNITDLVGGIKG